MYPFHVLIRNSSLTRLTCTDTRQYWGALAKKRCSELYAPKTLGEMCCIKKPKFAKILPTKELDEEIGRSILRSKLLLSIQKAKSCVLCLVPDRNDAEAPHIIFTDWISRLIPDALRSEVFAHRQFQPL